MTESSGFTRRHFLTVATAVTGGVGLAATAVPFVSSFKPSARAQALGVPVEVDVSKIEPGALLKVEWRGKAIYILHRSEAMLNVLSRDARVHWSGSFLR
jgi:ubiquinol-cytochrome c reductase iron-sulfur subunit